MLDGAIVDDASSLVISTGEACSNRDSAATITATALPSWERGTFHFLGEALGHALREQQQPMAAWAISSKCRELVT